jgi:hypothetical protein
MSGFFKLTHKTANGSPSYFIVPEGHLTVAQRFIAGERQAPTCCFPVPQGRLNRDAWGRFIRPYGTAIPVNIKVHRAQH